MIAPGNDRKRPLRRRFAEQRLCRVLDGVVAPRADGDPRWLGGLGQGKGQFQHAMVAVGGDVSRRRRWSGYSTIKDESWTAKVPCCRFCPCGSASEFGERERVGFRFLAPRTRPVRHRRAGRYRSRRLLLARAATTCRRRAWDGQVRRQHGAEVVPAGTADRGDVLGGVSPGTVPTAGAVRESTTTRPRDRGTAPVATIQRMSRVSRPAGSRNGRDALFQSVDRAGEKLTGWPLTRPVVLAMIKRRGPTGCRSRRCCHTFRATGDHGVPRTGDPRARPAESPGRRCSDQAV